MLICDHRINVLAVAAPVCLMTNNPDTVATLERYGIRVSERVPHAFPSNGPTSVTCAPRPTAAFCSD